LVTLALKLCQAYTNGTGLSFGGKNYSAEQIALIVDALDVVICPLVNPDGRTYVQSPAGQAMWRKSRALNPGQPCRGVDLNRNSDFLWSSGIGTSSSSCSDVFKGPSAFSEPETRNVRHLLDDYPNIGYFIDVHAPSLTPKSGKYAALLWRPDKSFSRSQVKASRSSTRWMPDFWSFCWPRYAPLSRLPGSPTRRVVSRGYDAYATEPRRQAERPGGI
jgi:hypothetical protein